MISAIVLAAIFMTGFIVGYRKGCIWLYVKFLMLLERLVDLHERLKQRATE